MPLIVKSLNEDGSYGISQASVVDTDDKLAERVGFIHERVGTPAIAEQYIEGREIYVGVLGNDRLRVLPVWELDIPQHGQGAWPIATEKVKHDPDYQERRGILHGPAKNLEPELKARIQQWQNESTGRWSSMDMPASISACPPRALRIFSKQIPIPRSRRARNSRRPLGTTASLTETCCIVF